MSDASTAITVVSTSSTDAAAPRPLGRPVRRAWFVWRTQGGRLSTAIFFDDPPNPKTETTRILASHELSDVLLGLVLDEPVAPWGALERAYPPPASETAGATP